MGASSVIPDHWGAPAASTYHDTPDGDLDRGGRELRVRVIESDDVGEKAVLTYKAARIDATSQPEHEVVVSDADDLAAVLTGLGYRPVIRFEKQCTNFRFGHRGRGITATVVHLPELSDHKTFVEIETLVDDPADIDEATATIRSVLHEHLGLDDDDITDELYTDAVRQHRQNAP